MTPAPASKPCACCGVRPIDTALEEAVLRLLRARPAGATICPSEAARDVAPADAPGSPAEEAWRSLMEPARAAARRLVVRGEVEITQGGRVVADPSHAKGPIRIRKRRSG